MWLIRFCFLVLIFAYIVRKNLSELISDEKQAWEFINAKEEAYLNFCMTGNNSDLEMTTQSFTWRNFTDPALKRAFHWMANNEALSKEYYKVSHVNESTRNREIWLEMRNIYSRSGVCIYHGEDKRNIERNCTTINGREIIETFSKIGNAEEREYYWIAWRNSVGKMRSIYDERMRILKKLKLFPNYNNLWVNNYDETAAWIAQEMKRALQEIFPLYKELHAFVRRRLIKVYGTKQITNNGPIPSHLLGLKTKHWLAIEEVALPYPEANLNVTGMMKKKNMTLLDLLKLAEDFYHSLGLSLLDDNFWNNTHVTANGSCGFRANYTCRGEIHGITACRHVDELSLLIIIGYTMDTYIANEEKKYWWPHVLSPLPNPAFPRALRFPGELSSWTTDYLSQIGLIEDIPTNCVSGQATAHDINHLMKAAISLVAMIPHDYKVMRWMSDSYDFTISDEDYNKKWWEYSLEFQGICPPVRRTEEHFDPASSQEVAGNREGINDFMATIYGFQFYKAACKEAGHGELLHRCNLYGVKTLGDKIRTIINLGRSIHWREGISLMTNGESDNMDTKPLLDYFQPLYEWLKKENENETIGWQSNDPMVCS